jgi:hypothetical protein
MTIYLLSSSNWLKLWVASWTTMRTLLTIARKTQIKPRLSKPKSPSENSQHCSQAKAIEKMKLETRRKLENIETTGTVPRVWLRSLPKELLPSRLKAVTTCPSKFKKQLLLVQLQWLWMMAFIHLRIILSKKKNSTKDQNKLKMLRRRKVQKNRGLLVTRIRQTLCSTNQCVLRLKVL